MPFTFSHPAAVLPFNYLPKRFISMTGLVTGSMAPDFEYFIRMKDRSVYSHTWAGIFYFDLPLTIILAFLFHNLVRNDLIDNLPGFLKNRLQFVKDFNWSKHFKANFTIVVISVIIGVATHIVWDGFTHAHAQFVEIFTILKKHVSIHGRRIPLFILMQFFGTLIGGLIVIYAIMKLPIDKPVSTKRSIFPFWFSVSLVMLIVILIRLLTGISYRNFDDMIVVIISGGLTGLIITSLLNKLRKSKNDL